MILIPTVTGSRNIFDIHLTSPSLNKKINEGNVFTIIDCHTFYLKKRRKSLKKIYNHYLYYVDYVADMQENKSMIFVVPDWCWILDNDSQKKLLERWNLKINTGTFLLTETNFEPDKIIGIAGRKIFKNDINWFHNFSKRISPDPLPEDILLTYDTQCYDKDTINEKLLQRTCESIQALL